MSNVFVAIVVFMFAGIACATDFVRLAKTGIVEITGQAGDDLNPDAPDTLSIGLHRIDTDENLFCAPVVANEIVVGLSTQIVSSGQKIWLQLFAYSEPDCTGIRSDGSDDRYRIVLSSTGKPKIIKIIKEPGS